MRLVVGIGLVCACVGAGAQTFSVPQSTTHSLTPQFTGEVSPVESGAPGVGDLSVSTVPNPSASALDVAPKGAPAVVEQPAALSSVPRSTAPSAGTVVIGAACVLAACFGTLRHLTRRDSVRA